MRAAGGIHVPSSDRAPLKVAQKKAFLTSVLQAVGGLAEQERKQLILICDYNVISRTHRPRYPAFQTFEYARRPRLCCGKHKTMPAEASISWQRNPHAGVRLRPDMLDATDHGNAVSDQQVGIRGYDNELALPVAQLRGGRGFASPRNHLEGAVAADVHWRKDAAGDVPLGAPKTVGFRWVILIQRKRWPASPQVTGLILSG